MPYSKPGFNALLSFHGSTVEYLNNGAMVLKKRDSILTITKVSKTTFEFSLLTQSSETAHHQSNISYQYIFDVVDKFLTSHFSSDTLPYATSKLITLNDYLDEERRRTSKKEFFNEIKSRKSESRYSLGGNRFVCDIINDFIILTDDLVAASTNVLNIDEEQANLLNQ